MACNFTGKKTMDRSAPCSVDGCLSQVGKNGAKGMCGKHYQYFNREAKRKNSTTTCGCGCGTKTVPGFRFAQGHHSKTPDGRLALHLAKRSATPTERGRYLSLTVDIGVKKYQHVIIAEKAIGRKLPSGAEIHHVDLNRLNNTNSNLVVCPSRSYHKLLHMRTRAVDACGNAGWIKCWICKKYDDPKNMYVRKSKGRHVSCHIAYEKARTGQK